METQHFQEFRDKPGRWSGNIYRFKKNEELEMILTHQVEKSQQIHNRYMAGKE
jgi:hypothetical protein